jgi:hypothetical protein
MNQDNYEFVRLIHQQQYETHLLQMEVNKASQVNPTLRQRSRLYLSDVLLNLGQRIRQAEFRVHVHAGGTQEGTLEIKAEGC